MGSTLTIMEYFTSLATVGYLFVLITQGLYPQHFWGYAFLIGLFIGYLVSSLKIKLWYNLFGHHAIPFGKNLLITAILLYILHQRNIIDSNSLLIISIIYMFIITKSLNPFGDGYDANAAKGWWKNPK